MHSNIRYPKNWNNSAGMNSSVETFNPVYCSFSWCIKKCLLTFDMNLNDELVLGEPFPYKYTHTYTHSETEASSTYSSNPSWPHQAVSLLISIPRQSRHFLLPAWSEDITGRHCHHLLGDVFVVDHMSCCFTHAWVILQDDNCIVLQDDCRSEQPRLTQGKCVRLHAVHSLRVCFLVVPQCVCWQSDNHTCLLRDNKETAGIQMRQFSPPMMAALTGH